MAVDWGFAAQTGGFGFGLVFVVLIILAVVTWLIGVVMNRITGGEDKTGETQKGD